MGPGVFIHRAFERGLARGAESVSKSGQRQVWGETAVFRFEAAGSCQTLKVGGDSRNGSAGVIRPDPQDARPTDVGETPQSDEIESEGRPTIRLRPGAGEHAVQPFRRRVAEETQGEVKDLGPDPADRFVLQSQAKRSLQVGDPGEDVGREVHGEESAHRRQTADSSERNASRRG